MIPIKNWYVYPEYNLAINVHNSARAVLTETLVVCAGVPAPYMIQELAEWWGRYTRGER